MLQASVRLIPLSLASTAPNDFASSCISFTSQHNQQRYQRQLKQRKEKNQLVTFCSSYVVGGGFPDEELDLQDRTDRTRRKQHINGDQEMNNAQYEAILKGGEQVTSVLQEMITLLENMNMNEASAEVAVELTAQGVIGKRVDEMEPGFMMALDYMIQQAENDQDDKVQVIGLLCRTPQKDSRHELMRRVAAGGGVFKGENGLKVHLPCANLNDIANQADDLLETMETRPVVPDRKLLARLVLIREEARNMMGGGILDERNDRGFNTLPESEVNFLTKLVALKPGKTVGEMIKNVMLGKDEGADNDVGDQTSAYRNSSGIAGRVGFIPDMTYGSVTGKKPLPVRPGMFLETVTKVLGGIYSGNVPGITAQHLEWVTTVSPDSVL
ncbi:protein PEP-RELATED DEVELOPMENT ARRESTED 1 [Citrus sinensis]|uniref:Protein PEP-RELATED DEVELOPMENT ARRESTED 1 n=1 Tax=Citrus sinensis TaxID=2711 RepID=A0ACB8N825_CITSI|nr:protein PEP-RELATED DEVELOPMENT ARRESTED 1 [Citrus sinensis]